MGCADGVSAGPEDGVALVITALFHRLFAASEHIARRTNRRPGIWHRQFVRDYLDPTMRELTSENGPFWRLEKLGDERTLPDAWPLVNPPTGMF